MEDEANRYAPDLAEPQGPALRFLVESALKSLLSESADANPKSKSEWVARLGDALMSTAEADHQNVISSLIASGVSTDELYQFYVPEASRYLGELWVNDEASFVDVTTGASRLQLLFRDRGDLGANGQMIDRSIPLGQSVLMVIPLFEQHSLGAFVAADALRRHGLWIRMAIGLTEAEIADLIAKTRFSMVGLSLATWKSVEKVDRLVEYLRANVECVPPIVAGGRIVEDRQKVEQRAGVDFAVKSIREAIERCGLTVGADSKLVNGVL